MYVMHSQLIITAPVFWLFVECHETPRRITCLGFN